MRLVLIFVVCGCGHFQMMAQLFNQVQIGRIVATRSDSRSVNFIDVNDDGWEDIFISNGLEGGQDDLLYLNDGKGQFNQVEMDISKDGLASVGATFADVNNDGMIDGFVTNWYGQRDGYFENDANVLRSIDINIRKSSFAEAASWGDFDKDGWLDLYVATSGGSRKNALFRGLGEGVFEEVTNGLPVEEQDPSRSVNWIDANGDGHLDLFVTNESRTPNDLYLNDGTGQFSGIQVGLLTTFTSSWGDVDNDGDFDLFLGNTNITSGISNQLMINEGGAFTQKLTGTLHTDGGCTNGSAFGDYDNDGDLDLVVTNGFCNEAKNFLYANQGDGTFLRADEELPNLRNICSFGVAWGDINNDGFLDLMIANCKMDRNDAEQTNDLYENQGNGNHWLKIRLVGTMSNSNAIGATIRAKVSIQEKETWLSRHISAQTGYCGQNSLWAHFGLGDANVVDSVVVNWPSGRKDVLTKIPINQHLQIEEGTITSQKEHSMLTPVRLVYPNPWSTQQGSLWLVLRDAKHLYGQPLQVNFSDTSGVPIWQETVRFTPNELIRIDLKDKQLLPGTYLLSVRQGAWITSKTISVF